MSNNANESSKQGNQESRPVNETREATNDYRNVLFGSFIFLFISGSIFVFICAPLPKFDESEWKSLKIPRNLEDVKNLARILDRYKEKYFYHVLFGICFIYISLQTFAIPGSIFLSVLCGFLFPFPLALFVVCLCSGVGASLCYCLSFFMGRFLIYRFWAERANNWSQIVSRHQEDLIHYIIFLRITPFLPNWFINVASPVVGVPLRPFFIGTVLGVAPPSFLAIQTGTSLYELSSTSQSLSWFSIVLLFLFAVMALLPVLLQHRLRRTNYESVF